MARGLLAAALVASAVTAQAQTITLDMVPVGNPGNAADPSTGYGAVSYSYDIGKYDVTLGQYTTFLNDVAKTDTYGLYNSLNSYPEGILQSGSPGSLSYSVMGSNPQAANCPVYNVSWGDAARLCNWLQNGQPSGAEGNGTTETGAYTLNGGASTTALMAVKRNAGATYFIPTENEWYKAAFFDSTLNGNTGGYWLYPTKSNTAPGNALPDTGNNANIRLPDNALADPTYDLTPVGDFVLSPSAYGTFDQMGDVFQWDETAFSSSTRGLRGSDWSHSAGAVLLRFSSDPSIVQNNIGFRIASSAAVPEPGILALLTAAVCGAALYRRVRSRRQTA